MRRRRNPEIIAGRVNGNDGSMASADPGVTSSRSSAGVFVLNFESGFRVRHVVVTPITNNDIRAAVTFLSASSVQVNVFGTAIGTGSDFSWGFVAVGAQT
jgi:hypothetical protein